MATSKHTHGLETNYRLAIKVASDLRSINGENPEYDRALSELIADLFDLPIEEYGETLDVRAIGVAQDIRKYQSQNK